MGSAPATEIVNAVEQAGYGAEAIEDDVKRRERQQETALATPETLSLAGHCRLAGWRANHGMGHAGRQYDGDRRQPLAVAGYRSCHLRRHGGGGRPFYTSAWKSLRNGSATMDMLVALGTGAATGSTR